MRCGKVGNHQWIYPSIIIENMFAPVVQRCFECPVALNEVSTWFFDKRKLKFAKDVLYGWPLNIMYPEKGVNILNMTEIRSHSVLHTTNEGSKPAFLIKTASPDFCNHLPDYNHPARPHHLLASTDLNAWLSWVHLYGGVQQKGRKCTFLPFF